MPICECGCGQSAKKRFVSGHQLRKRAALAVTHEVVQAVAATQAKHGPPPYPAPFDRRLFRLAAEKPGTLVTNPWVGLPCAECHEECFTREENPKYGEIICEDCLWAISESLGEGQVRRGQLMARVPFDPFQ